MTRLLFFLVLSGCSSVAGPGVASYTWNLEPYEAPSLYTGWHEELQECIGESLDFDAINWFSATLIYVGGLSGAGLWMYPDTIVVLEPYVYYERVVKHELTHYVRQNGVHDDLLAQCSLAGG